MPLDPKRSPQALIEAARTGHLVPLIGAGVSRHAKTRESYPFPGWGELIGDLTASAEGSWDITPEDGEEIRCLIAQGKHLMAAQILKFKVGDVQLQNYLKRRFAPEDAEPGPIHMRLFDLQPPVVLTTNYDTLLEQAYYLHYGRAPFVKTFAGAAEVEKRLKSHRQWTDPPAIFKLHGSIDTPREIIFTEKDYRHLRYRAPGYRTVLSAIFVTKVLLMLGFSLADPELMLLIESLGDSLEAQKHPDYVVLPAGRKGRLERRRLKDDFGLEVIEYEPTSENDHREVFELVDYLVSFVPVNAGAVGV